LGLDLKTERFGWWVLFQKNSGAKIEEKGYFCKYF
jgi:hypothetical protein